MATRSTEAATPQSALQDAKAAPEGRKWFGLSAGGYAAGGLFRAFQDAGNQGIEVPATICARAMPRRQLTRALLTVWGVVPAWGSKPEPPKIPSADQRGLSRARSMG